MQQDDRSVSFSAPKMSEHSKLGTQIDRFGKQVVY